MTESITLEVLSACAAGAFSASALYPLEVLKTKMQAESKTTQKDDDNNEDGGDDDNDDDDANKKQTDQVQKKKTSNMVEYAKQMYQNEGITPFYAGIGTSAFQSSAEKALYFFAYTALKNIYSILGKTKDMGSIANLILGCMAEWAHLPITLPLDCWTTQIQTGNNGGKAPIAILMTMLSEGDGIRGMYKGIQAYTVLCLKPAIQYTVYEQVKKIMLVRKRLSGAKGSLSESLTTAEAFLLGMVARTIATIAVYPYLRAKVMLQSSKTLNGGNEKPNIPAMIMKMYVSGGLAECFQGIGPELTRGVFSAALMLACKERIHDVVKKVLKA